MPANDPNALAFGRVADAYERGRPDYPEEVVDWLLAGVAGRIVEVGAGTGKLTRGLVGRGCGVIAVEPSAGMRSAFRQRVPGVTVLAGAAERLPLPDACADAVIAAQAWHWVDPMLGGPEAARVLRPGGILGLVWNDRDDSDAWVATLSGLLEEYGTSPDAGYVPVAGPPFGLVETLEVRWSNRVSVDAAVDMIASRSYVIGLPDAVRGELLARVRGHALAHLRMDATGHLDVAYVTRAYRVRRP